ncbi:MAG: hypothetical protein AAFX76_11960 [Planctomycetota bacterium]
MRRFTRLFADARSTLTRLHRDERGAEGLEKLLIIAAVVLPLLGLLIVFRDEMGNWVRGTWEEVRNDAETDVPGTAGGGGGGGAGE